MQAAEKYQNDLHSFDAHSFQGPVQSNDTIHRVQDDSEVNNMEYCQQNIVSYTLAQLESEWAECELKQD